VKRIDRKLVRKSRIFNIYEDTILTDDNKEVIYDFLEHKGAAAVVPVLEDGRILMVHQFRNAIDRYTWEIPAGCRDSVDEDFKTAAARELEEESGYRSDDLEFLIRLKTAVAFCSEQIDVFVARNLKKSHQHLDDDEFIDVKAFTIEELKEMIFKGELQDAKSVASIMSYINKYLK